MKYIEGKELTEFENIANNWRGNYEMIDEMALSKTLNTDFTDKITLHVDHIEIDSRFSKEGVLKELSEFDSMAVITISYWNEESPNKSLIPINIYQRTLVENL